MKLVRAIDLLSRTPKHVHPRLALVHFLLAPFPPKIASRLRLVAYRWVGFKVGKATSIMGNITFNADGYLYPRLSIGEGCLITTPLYLDLNAPVTIGNRVTLSRHTIVLTDTHEIGPSYARMGKMRSLPVTIEDGAWLCAACLIHPGVTVGRGSVVSAGAVVTKDVPPNTMVAGVPARVVQHLPEEPMEDARISL